MAVSGHTTVVKQTGTAVSMTTEATTSLSSSVYQITDTTKRIIDPDTALSVIDNGGAVADADVTINYLFGKITKNSGSFTGPVTITGAYLPTYAVAEAKGATINLERTLLDSTVMAAATANIERTVGLKSASGSINQLDNLRTDLDSGGTTIVPFTDFGAGTRRVLEVTLPSTLIFRAFVRFNGIDETVNVEDLLNTTLEWQSTTAIGTGQTEGSSFGFSDE